MAETCCCYGYGGYGGGGGGVLVVFLLFVFLFFSKYCQHSLPLQHRAQCRPRFVTFPFHRQIEPGLEYERPDISNALIAQQSIRFTTLAERTLHNLTLQNTCEFFFVHAYESKPRETDGVVSQRVPHARCVWGSIWD